MFDADGNYLERWPTNLGLVPDGEYPANSWIFAHGGFPFPEEEPDTVSPGGEQALDCPTADYLRRGNAYGVSYCPGDVTASGDLRHFIFATTWNIFAPGGQLGGTGSIYDNETDTGEVTVASKTPAGDNIQPEPGDEAGDPLAAARGVARRLADPDVGRRHRAMRIRDLPISALRVKRRWIRSPLPNATQPPVHAGSRSDHL